MSANNIYQPHVYINGRRLSEQVPIVDEVALADFTIKWGAADWYEDVEPSELTLTVLDPYSDFHQTAQGATVLVTRDDPDDGEVIVWRGKVDVIATDYTPLRDERTGKKRDMWTHEITADDPLADLERDRRRGPLHVASSRGIHWGPCNTDQRLADLQARTSISLDDFSNDAPVSNSFAGYAFNAVVSTLTVLRSAARAWGALNRPYYDPLTGTNGRIITPLPNLKDPYPTMLGSLANAPGAEIRLTSIYPWFADINIGEELPRILIPGSQVSIDDGIRVSTAESSQATHLEIDAAETVSDGEPAAKSFAINIIPKAGTQQTIRVETDIESSEIRPGESGPASHRERAGRVIENAYGLSDVDPIQYRFDKHAPAPDWAMLLLNSSPAIGSKSDAFGSIFTVFREFQLIESLTNVYPTAAPFGIVGGELNYTDTRGWTITFNPAPLRFNTLPAPTPLLGDIQQDATLATVTDGSFVGDWQQIDAAN